MAAQRTSCVFDGDTFIGTFAETGRGTEASVTVRFAGRERTLWLGTLSARSAAQRLLSGLVQENFPKVEVDVAT